MLQPIRCGHTITGIVSYLSPLETTTSTMFQGTPGPCKQSVTISIESKHNFFLVSKGDTVPNSKNIFATTFDRCHWRRK